MSDLEHRVMELEIKNSHHEDTIEQLNQIIFEQQKNIDTISRHLEQVQSKINHMQENSTIEESEPPPPHY
ncbi:MAG: SlyX family protein [gamma proteobacterium symbiont of Taylorina sp.]|nr:SlyX family protein [gamma proteobacterium symbiont of Taylorina sp.]